MATDVATLAIKVTSDDVGTADKRLAGLERAGAAVEGRLASMRGAVLATGSTIKAAGADIGNTEKKVTDLGAAAKTTGDNVGAAEKKIASFGATGAAVEGTLGSMRAAMLAFGTAAAIAATIGIGHKIVEESKEAQAAQAQLEAAIRSTGGAAGFTSKQLRDMASHLQDVSTFSDETVQRGQAMLLTFRNIRGDQFKDATQAIVDMAAAFQSTDLAGQAIQVGKALNDPIQGISALSRVGVQFSESQKEVIKNLVETGRVAEAQRIILAELKTEFGGSAEAARNTLGGALAHLSNAWGEVFEVSSSSSRGIVVAINGIAEALPALRSKINQFVTETIVGANNLTAAWLAVNAVMSADLTKGLGPLRQRLIEIAEERRAANAMARGGGADDQGPGPTGTPPKIDLGSDEAAKALKTFEALRSARTLEIAHQRALNEAFGQSDKAIAELNLRYDALAEKARNHAQYSGAQRAALDAQTDAMRAAKQEALDMAAALDRIRRVRAAQNTDEDRTAGAREALELSRLDEQSAARRRVDLEAEDELRKAWRDYTLEIARLDEKTDAERIRAAKEIYDLTVKGIEARRGIGHETVVNTQARDEAKKEEADAKRRAEQRVREVSKQASNIVYEALDALGHRRNPFQVWFDAGKNAINRALADIVGNKVGALYEQISGRGPNAAATKQITAGQIMSGAGDKMLQAAITIAQAAGIGITRVPTQPGTANTAQAQTGMDPRVARALGVAGIALGGLQTGYGVGGALYSTSHGAAGNYARGAIGGAGAGALAGATIGSVVPGIGTAIGAVVGGAAGLIGGLLGIGSASKEAKKQLAELQKTLSEDMASLRASVTKDALAEGEAQIAADRERRRKQIEEAYQGGGRNSETVRKRIELLTEMNALEDEALRQLRERIALEQARQKEDYEARRDAATPGNEEAEARAAFIRQQKREREDLVLSFGPEIDAREAATLAALDQAQAAEFAAAAAKGFGDAVGDATASVRNAPEGFWVEQYTRDYAQRRAATGPTTVTPDGRPKDATPSIPTQPMTFPNAQILLQIPEGVTDPTVFAKKFLDGVRRMIDLTGINMTVAEAMETF